MFVKKIVREYLKQKKYDGLVWFDDTTEFVQCECYINSKDFMHCSSYWDVTQCQAAKKITCDNCKKQYKCWDKKHEGKTACLIPD